MEGEGAVVGKKAPNFILSDQDGKDIALNEICKNGPVMIAFYPGDFTLTCTKQLCNYRDNLNQFTEMGVTVLGISKNSPTEHKKFSDHYSLTFPLLSDPDKDVAKKFKCESLVMLGAVSRAVDKRMGGSLHEVWFYWA